MELHKGREVVHPTSRAEWRAWLDANHAASPGVWLSQWRRATGRPIVPYDDLVEEALCFGWIDSTVNRLDDERSAILMTPRKRGSTWAVSNRARVERLRAAGLMAPAGLAAVEAAQADGTWSAIDAVEALIEPDDLAAALDAVPDARAGWERLPPSTRKQLLWWVVSAKRPDTRERRIATIVHDPPGSGPRK